MCVTGLVNNTPLLRFSSDFDETFRLSFYPSKVNSNETRHGWVILTGPWSYNCLRSFGLWTVQLHHFLIRSWFRLLEYHFRIILNENRLCWVMFVYPGGGVGGITAFKQYSSFIFHPISVKLLEYLSYPSKISLNETIHGWVILRY